MSSSSFINSPSMAFNLISLSFFSFFFFAIFAFSAADDITPAETLPLPHHHHAPTPAPLPPPTHLPLHPPAHPPTHHRHHAHGQPPVHPPANAPSHHLPPTHSPAHSPAPAHHHHHHHNVSPVPPPTHSPAPIYPPKPRLVRSFISVQGVVYCKSCKYAGADTLLGATPVAGASVKLICQNTKYPLVQTATTDKNGYFFITAPKAITSYAFHKCKVVLGKSPSPTCSKPSALHGGAAGAPLRPQKSYIDANKLPFVLYSVGPFAFEPTCPHH
ncbi:non-classical arabinogalactan protein 31-like [Cucumis melo var. makuwa]|uniref:Non-classical arabinogalactan protein 31-like n=3 Tax=Cucumis melo TaxID=3656 RepID=A0A5A7U9U1_CUCMM|nr:non-classical arabinogalactan protein 31-like [Cucumis melo]KAA0052683.1 non-classical arabinogalactan protein 31-like [Cucumis melo var. makuwa]